MGAVFAAGGTTCLLDRGRRRAEHQAHHRGGEQAHRRVRLRVCPEQPPEQRHRCAQSQHHVSPCGVNAGLPLCALACSPIPRVSEKHLQPVRGCCFCCCNIPLTGPCRSEGSKSGFWSWEAGGAQKVGEGSCGPRSPRPAGQPSERNGGCVGAQSSRCRALARGDLSSLPLRGLSARGHP